MKIEQFKAIVTEVYEGESKTAKLYRKLTLKIPGYTDEFGEKRGKDQFFEAFVFSPALEKLPKPKFGDHVQVTAYLNGFQNATNEGKIFYTTTLSITDLKIVN